MFFLNVISSRKTIMTMIPLHRIMQLQAHKVTCGLQLISPCKHYRNPCHKHSSYACVCAHFMELLHVLAAVCCLFHVHSVLT